MADLTPYEEIIKQELSYEVYELWERLKANGSATLRHCFMEIKITNNPLRVEFLNNPNNFAQSITVFLELIEDRINRDPLGFNAMDFSVETLVASSNFNS